VRGKFERKDHLISIKPFLLHCNTWIGVVVCRTGALNSCQSTTVIPIRQHFTSRNRPSGLSVDDTLEVLLHSVIMSNLLHNDPDNGI